MSKFTRAEVRRIVGENCTDEIENGLIALYLGAVDPMKDEIQKYKAEAEKLPAVQKELDELKAAEESGKDAKKQYNELKKQYDALQKSVEDGKVLGAKKEAYKKLCETAGLSEKGIEKALKYADFGSVELDEKGEIKDAEKHQNSVKTEWADYVQSAQKKGADVENPPKSANSSDPQPSHAAELAAKYRANLYGKPNNE